MKTVPNPRLLLLALLAVLPVTACAPQDESGAPDTPQALAPVGSLEDATALEVRNARQPLPHLVTAGQLTEAQLAGLAEAGFKNFISLRLPDEEGAGWEEGYAQAHDMSFTRLPVAGAGGLTREAVEALDGLLDAAGDEPTVLYCGSGNRVGALLALRAYWLDGAGVEDAIELGRAAGMTRLEPAVADLLGAVAR
jgi:uncharacterized protein (TIGR01244 family)